MKAIIVGGGIGGLAAAIALRRVGHEVDVIERATELAEIGAGLSIAPNALAALERLGPEALRQVRLELVWLEQRPGSEPPDVAVDDVRPVV